MNCRYIDRYILYEKGIKLKRVKECPVRNRYNGIGAKIMTRALQSDSHPHSSFYSLFTSKFTKQKGPFEREYFTSLLEVFFCVICTYK